MNDFPVEPIIPMEEAREHVIQLREETVEEWRLERNKLKRALHDLEVELAPWRGINKKRRLAMELGVVFASFAAVCVVGNITVNWLGMKAADDDAARKFFGVVAMFVGLAVLHHFGKGRPSSRRRPTWRDDLMKEPWE
jgi:hypothetical protein